ncbi:MAG: AI-2E family transporter [Anaerolineales bacterium]
MTTNNKESSILSALIGGASLIIVVFGMKYASSILSPIILAFIIAVSTIPLVKWLIRKGVPDWLALLITIALLIVTIVGLIALIGVSIDELIVTLPQYADNLQGQKETLQTQLGNLGIGAEKLPSLNSFDPSKLLEDIGGMLGGIVGVLSGVVLMLLVLIFMLLDTAGFTTRLKIGFPENDPTMVRFSGLVRDLRQYVSITTKINLFVGLVDTIFLLILGVDFALLWGLLAFLLGYIPSVGFWFALIPPFILALFEFGITKALIVLVGYILINGGVQNFLQPKMMGSGLNLSPLVVVISLFFWAWVLGPIGALLAVPMTIIVKEIFLEGFDDTRGLAGLMGSRD